ncbi:MAG TPA: hypothetical protein VJT16_13310 [Streptosporangiaceae bacterium]|jgi:hypothetical protein|nr:hypothetical protein [Streptosporangiaceae bacterium]
MTICTCWPFVVVDVAGELPFASAVPEAVAESGAGESDPDCPLTG